MKPHSFASLLLMLCAITRVWAADCSPGSPAAEVTWSKRQTIVSPDCRWTLEIIPGTGDVAQAHLGSADAKVDVPLFSMTRSGAVFWHGSDMMAFEDRQYSNTYRIQVYDLTDPRQRSGEALQLDQLVRKRIEHDLGASKSIAYYFPKFVAWSAGGLVVSVGVESTRGRSGSFTFHCYGFELALRPARIVAAFHQDELQSRYKSACQEFPQDGFPGKMLEPARIEMRQLPLRGPKNRS